MNTEKARKISGNWLAMAGLALVVFAAVAGLAAWRNSLDFHAGARQEAVRGGGSIEGTMVVVRSQLPGQLVEMKVREGQWLDKGDLIAALDADELEAKVAQAGAQVEVAARQVDQARAALEGARLKSDQAAMAVDLADRRSAGQVDQAQAAVQAAQANLTQAEVALEKAEDDYRRYQDLYQKGVATEAQLTAAASSYRLAMAGLDAAQEGLKQAEASLKVARTGELQSDIERKEEQGSRIAQSGAEANLNMAVAQEDVTRAVLREAQAVLDKSRIFAPLGGTVINKLVEEGELVAPGSPLVRLADLNNLELTIYITGRDLGRVKLGQSARVFIDTSPEKPLEGRVTFISQEAEFTPKNVHMPDERAKMVYAVKISLSNPEGLLKPGMPADAEILKDEGR